MSGEQGFTDITILGANMSGEQGFTNITLY